VQVVTIYYIYVLDNEQRLVGIASMRDLFRSSPDQKVQDMMRVQLITVADQMDQEEISDLFAKHGLMALPVVDDQGRMKGVVTVDDIVDVVKEESTEDNELAKAVILALFLPLIISAGGNAGSQASTLVIRAMALGEVKLRDWWRIVEREIVIGLSLGFILALVGFLRIVVWEAAFKTYGEYYMLIALTVAASVVGVVMWGTLVGSLLPLILRRLGMDPASASAPFVATLADVTGLIIYFTVASTILRGTLL
jgi:magnesium transporter